MGGLLIAFEGCDRSGKSTQSRLLCDNLTQRGYSSELRRFPRRESIIGDLIDKYLKLDLSICDEAIHLLFSANRWENIDEINQLLSKGTIVILDRYISSGRVFSIAKGLDREWCIYPDLGLPTPTITILLDLDPENASKRGEYGEERHDTQDFQIRVRSIYLEEQSRNVDWIIIDANQDMNTINTQILSAIEPLLNKI
jgi:dTMP kinase